MVNTGDARLITAVQTTLCTGVEGNAEPDKKKKKKRKEKRKKERNAGIKDVKKDQCP